MLMDYNVMQYTYTVIILLLLVRCSYKYAYNNMALYSSLMYFSTDVYIYVLYICNYAGLNSRVDMR